MSEPLLTVWLPMPLADAAASPKQRATILEDAIQDQLGRRVEVADAPVSRAEYRAFCEAKGRKMPEPGSEGWGEDKPVTYVSREDAEAFCEWAGVRLPTEKEWLEKIGDAKIDETSVWEHVAEMEDGYGVLRGDSATNRCRCPPDLRLNVGFRVAEDVQADYEPDTEHHWGIRLCMCLQYSGWQRWRSPYEAFVIDDLLGRLFANWGQIAQRSVQILSVNCPPEKAGIRLECWHVPAPHNEGADG